MEVFVNLAAEVQPIDPTKTQQFTAVLGTRRHVLTNDWNRFLGPIILCIIIIRNPKIVWVII